MSADWNDLTPDEKSFFESKDALSLLIEHALQQPTCCELRAGLFAGALIGMTRDMPDDPFDAKRAFDLTQLAAEIALALDEHDDYPRPEATWPN